ncbi:MAG: low-specificity L-threonine aldolase [Nitrospinales bacterium]
MKKTLDLRSDTVTQPTATMREAMARAEVGDDVLNEDPTLHRLQELAARKMGKEEALFVPSGTMGNLVSILTHCGRGDEVILGDQSHIFLNEVGGLSALGGVHPRIISNNDDGTLPLDILENAIREKELHHPTTRLICLENSHNYCHGSPITSSYMKSVAEIAARHSLIIHLDGARIFNAAVALSEEASELARYADSVMFCLSKGLSAPVGSLICGKKEFISKARKYRKMVGGGMRQAGHLAAAGIVALDEMVDRIREDHFNARDLAEGLATIPGVHLEPEKVKTNIIFFKLLHPKVTGERFLTDLDSMGIKLLLIEPGIFRAVLHREISKDDVEAVLKIIQALLD